MSSSSASPLSVGDVARPANEGTRAGVGFQVTTLLSRTYQLPANLRPRSTNSSAIPRAPSILRAQPVTFLGCRLATGGGRRLKPT